MPTRRSFRSLNTLLWRLKRPQPRAQVFTLGTRRADLTHRSQQVVSKVKPHIAAGHEHANPVDPQTGANRQRTIGHLRQRGPGCNDYACQMITIAHAVAIHTLACIGQPSIVRDLLAHRAYPHTDKPGRTAP